MRRRRTGILALRILLLLIGLVMIGIPFLWILLTAFKKPVVADASPPVFFSALTLDNFRALFQDGYAHSLLNSAIITTLATGSTLIFGIPAGYAFARGKFRGRGFFGAFLLFSQDGAAGDLHHPAVPFLPSPESHRLFHRSDACLPDRFAALHGVDVGFLLPGRAAELEEAARVDGCSRLRAFFRIVLPLALPGVVSVGLLIGIAAWSEYFIPLLLGGFSTEPATVGIVDFIGVDGSSWGPMAAGALCLIVPVFLATLLAQRSLLDGLTAGALKG